MLFIDQTGSEKIVIAITKATNLFGHNSPMTRAISEKHDWKYNSGTADEIIIKLLNGPEMVKVKSWRPWNPWTSAIAMTKGDGNIYINMRKLNNFSTVDYVGTLCHEYSHLCGFHHGNNYKSQDKCNYSVPYYISENIHKWLT